MKEQKYITVMQDDAGHTIDFERWCFTKLETCITNFVALYKQMQYFDFIKCKLDKAKKIVTYKTNYETTEENKVHEMSIEEFMKMLNSNY